MKDLFYFLKGKKTYILGVILAALDVCFMFHILVWTPEQTMAVNGFLVTLMGMTGRAAITDVKEKMVKMAGETNPVNE